MTMSIRSARRAMLVTATAAFASLLLAGPANAACVAAAWDDDGTAETTHDHDYVDDTSRKTLTLATRPILPSAASLTMAGTSYGGCGEYQLLVNGTLDHTFYGCGAWNTQPVNPLLLQPGANVFEVLDTDWTWDTGILFSVDTSHSGNSVMIANGIPKTGELMWRLSVTALACV